jgi:hypothetical protein
LRKGRFFMGRLAEIGGALLSIGAGVYLLTKNGATITVGGQTGQSWFEVLAHGIGVYFVGKGAWMLGRVGQAYESARALERLVEIAEDAEKGPPRLTGGTGLAEKA